MDELSVEFDLSLNGTLGDAASSLLCPNDTLQLNGSWSDLCQTNDTNITFKDPSYYAIPYRIVGTIFQGFILMVGVLGNIMVVIVVCSTRSMKTPTNCYLVSLSVADLMVLLSAVPNEILSYYVLGEQWIWGRVGCALFIFFQYLGINASSLSITAFTIERYIAVCHPMRAQKMCTVHRAKNIIAGVWTFAILYCSPWLFLTKTEPVYYKGRTNIETCTFALSRQFYKGLFLVDLFIFYVFPLLLSLVLYYLIARILFSDPISKMSLGKTSAKNGGSNAASTEEFDGSGQSRSATSRKTFSSEAQRSASQSTDSARSQVVKMLIIVTLVFAILWFPYRMLLVYNSFAKERFMELWFLMFCKTMIFVNSAINPILYNALSVKFRRAFKKMLCCEPSSNRYQYPPARTTASGPTSVLKRNETAIRHGTTVSEVNV